MQIYIIEGQVQAGPFTIEEVKKKIEAGEYAEETLGWYDGISEWAPLKELFPQIFIEEESLQLVANITQPLALVAQSNHSKAWYENALVFVPCMLVCYPFGMIPLWMSKRFDTKTKIGFTAVIPLGVMAYIFVFTMLFGGYSGSRNVKSDTNSLQAANFGEVYGIEAGATVFFDENAVRQIVENYGQGESETRETLLKLYSANRGCDAEQNLAVKKIGELAGTPFWEVEVIKGESRGNNRLWVHTSYVFGTDSLRGMRAITGMTVFDGMTGTSVGNADVLELSDLVKGVYEGDASLEQAQECIFLPEAQKGEMVQELTGFYIYDATTGYSGGFRLSVEFALRKQGLDGKEFGTFPVQITELKTFTTKSGLVKMVPVIERIEEWNSVKSITPPKNIERITIQDDEGF